jgi:adenine-specific DNA-methyltransferase
MFYPLTAPDGTTVYPIRDDGRDGVWAMSLEGVEKKRERGLLIWKQRERNGETVWVPYAREYPADEPVRPYPTIWNDLWTMRQAKAKLKDIFKGETIFDTPKPPDLVERLIDLANVRPDGIVLDSFAGSGTTAEAVCAVNTGDDGHRRFILAEMESYADSITATRVRRIISGYKTSRNVSETIYEKKLSATNLKDVESYYEEALQTRDDAGKRHRFDKLSGPKMDGSSIVVVGITAKSEKTPGLDIGFSYYELGQALFDADGSIDQDVPREEILKYVWYSETKAPYVDMTAKHPYLLGTIGGTVYYFAYEPDEETVLGPKLLSTLPERGSITVIYADRCVLDDAKLDELGIVFKQIPRQIARM